MIFSGQMVFKTNLMAPGLHFRTFGPTFSTKGGSVSICCRSLMFFIDVGWLGSSILRPLGSLLAPWEGPWDHPGAPWGPDS